MFNPSRDEARRFLIDAWAKYRATAQPLTDLERIAARLVALHPEYHAMLEQPETVRGPRLRARGRRHQSVPAPVAASRGRRAARDRPAARHSRAVRAHSRSARGDEHAALHAVLECLGEVIWQAQRHSARRMRSSISTACDGSMKRAPPGALRVAHIWSIPRREHRPAAYVEIRGDVLDVLVGEALREAGHDRVLARARLVVAQRLREVVGILAGELRIFGRDRRGRRRCRGMRRRLPAPSSCRLRCRRPPRGGPSSDAPRPRRAQCERAWTCHLDAVVSGACE